MEPLEEKGYLIVATGDEYVECALACARSIKYHTSNASIALLSDKKFDSPMGEFNHSLTFSRPLNQDNPLGNDWQAFFETPYRQTIKIEADMIVPHSIEHWWPMLWKKDVVLTVGARNFRNEYATCRKYRKIFDENNLPDIYNAITYWKQSELARDFALLVKYMFARWDLVQPQIKMGLSDPGTTDVIYALAAKILGVENVTLPNTSFPTLIHMKGGMNDLIGEDWTKELNWELDRSNIRINTIDQQYPFHYYIKDFAKELNTYYQHNFWY